MSHLKILMVASEATPYAKTGGLGDVMGALPGALADLGYEVKVILPRYRSINVVKFGLNVRLESLTAPAGRGLAEVLVMTGRRQHDLVEYLFVDHPEYFDRSELYHDPKTGLDYADNDQRFAFFARAALETVRQLNWQPDIIHVHDWQAALIPILLKTLPSGDDFFAKAKTVLTIHNLGYQGLFDSDKFASLGLPQELFYAMTGQLEFYGRVSFLKGGIASADKITTVSPRYSEEIQATEEFGCGLQGILKERTRDLSGILNGVDYGVWSPRHDKKIPHRYQLSNLSGKKATRVDLVSRLGLPLRAKVPLVGMITRLVDQKGVDLLCAAADEIFALDMQMVILGTGDAEYHRRLTLLESTYPDKLKVLLEFDDQLAHEINAGADIFLMPSKYEPCGLNQMYALKYGTVPVVRKVGGLADTVDDYSEETELGTGFVFEDYTSDAMLEALRRSFDLFGRRQKWIKLMKRGMKCEFSWEKSAQAYAQLFESII